MRTGLTELLGLRAPVVQAPIGSASGPELAAAVSEAGGLGMLAMTWRDRDEVEACLMATRSLTAAPLGVNFVLAFPAAERLERCLGLGVEAVSFSWGIDAALIARARDGGAQVMVTVGSAAEARRALEAGADVLVAQGWEAGGHVSGEVAGLALIPAVVDVAGAAPVLAAGGIADGRGLAAALCLGAAGVWLGTRFLACEEAAVHPAYAAAVIAAQAEDAALAELYTEGWQGAPHRSLKNATWRAWDAAGRPGPGERPGEGEAPARWPDNREVLRYSDVIPLPGMSGAVEELALYAGQSAGLVRERRSAAAIIAALMDEARGALGRARGLVEEGEA